MHSYRHPTTRQIADEALQRTRLGVGATGATGPAGPVNNNTTSIAASAVITAENELVEVTAATGVVATIGAGINSMTLKDRSGSPTPIIGAAAQSGSIEDPNNLGTFVNGTVFLKQPGGAVSWRINKAGNYDVVSST